MERQNSSPLNIGTPTPMGKIEGITCTMGERYYFTIKNSVVGLFPASAIEEAVEC